MKEVRIILLASITLVLIGSFGLFLEDNQTESGYQVIPLGQEGTLKVEEATQKPQSTFDQLQGSGGLQQQGSQVQTDNAGASLQPNAGSSLPAGY